MEEKEFRSLLKKGSKCNNRSEFMKFVVKHVEGSELCEGMSAEDIKWFVRGLMEKFSESLPERFKFKAAS